MADEFGLEELETPKKAQETDDPYGLTPVRAGSSDTPASPGEAFTPRERRSFTGELSSGLKGIGRGLTQAVTDPLSIFARDIASTPQSQTLMGLLQAAGSPMFALGDPSAALGDVVEQGVGAVTGPGKTARYAGNVASFGGDLAQSMLLGKVGSTVRPIVERNIANRRLMSPRKQALELTDDLQHRIQQSDIAQSNIQSGTEAAVESAESIADAARASLPKAEELRRRFAPNAPLGVQAGKEFQSGWNNAFEKAKTTFDDLYGPIKREAESIPTSAEGFVAAGGTLKDAKGITGTPGTLGEKVAGRIPKIAESADDLEQKVLDQLASAEPGKRGDVLKDIMEGGDVPAQNATVKNLIDERQRLSAAWRVTKDDNARRQLKGLIDGLDADIAATAPDLSKRLSAVNARFATEYAPYFSKGSVTRAIAQGKPETVVDSIYRPSVSATGRSLKNDAIEAITRAKAVIKDPAQWERINGAFINKGIEQGFEEGVFKPGKVLQWWSKYKDAAGTNNEVLRKGLGEAGFKDMDAVFTQMGNARIRSLDEATKELVKNYKARGKELLAHEKSALKTTTTELQRRIENTLGNKTYVYRKLESIGAGIIASGTMRGNLDTIGRGGLIVVGAKTLGNILGLARGRSAWRAVVRSAPGTAEAAAAIKAFEAVANQIPEEVNSRE